MYKQEINLAHEEVAAKVNLTTGELQILKKQVNNLPDGKVPFGKDEKYWRKSFDPSWDFLETVLSDLELRVVQKLCRMAKMNTNSLEPLNDETTQIEISEQFNIDRRKAKSLFKKFHDLGIYGKFDVVREGQEYTKFWILNPYLSFGGKLIHSDIAKLFEGTKLTNEYNKRCKEKQKNS
jgi:hypothetical protein